jgi:hypothetical protein
VEITKNNQSNRRKQKKKRRKEGNNVRQAGKAERKAMYFTCTATI